jgi:hypothetical protein
MGYDIPENLDLASLETGSDYSPAPGTDGLPEGTQQGQQQQNSLTYDPNLPISYKASGKDLTEPLSEVIKRAQRGYDYAQLVNQHKQQVQETQAQWEQRQRQIQEMESQWKPYHEFAQQNPDWANHVRSQWENRFNSLQQSAPQNQSGFDQQQQQQQGQVPSNLPPEVQRELSEMRQFMSDVRQQQAAAQQAAQDAALADEINGIRKSYPDIDFTHTDPETGESLEVRVLRHAQENRIHNFEAAFKHYYFDKLMERNVMRAREDVAKTMQKNQKNGFLAQSNVPLMNQNNQPDLRRLSYHQLMDVAATELGI